MSDEAESVHIRAIARPIRTYYRMDTELNASDQFFWPITEVLLPIRLDASRLGIFAWSQIRGEKIFVPVRVYQNDNNSSQSINIAVRSAVEVENLMWRMFDGSGQSSWNNLASNAAAGETISFNLPHTELSIINIEVAASVKTSENWSKLRIKVFQP